MVKIARIDRRKPTNAAGLAKFGAKEVPVFLRDCSLSGARLRSKGPTALPNRFRLVVSFEKIDADCVVVWRRGVDCGVTFDVK